MTGAVRPIGALLDSSRLPEHGRIRFGASSKNARGKKIPRKLNAFRFTSQDQAAIEHLAEKYGGEPKLWEEGDNGEWVVDTTAKEIPVLLPPGALSGSPFYELYSGGGRERFCDGVTCETTQQTGDGAEKVSVPCMCSAAGAMKCKPKTILLVVLPDVDFKGVWRVQANGWTAAQTLPKMVDLIAGVQGGGLTRGVLILKQETRKVGGKTMKFPVPALGLDASIEELASGNLSLGGVPPGPALGPGAGLVTERPQLADPMAYDEALTVPGAPSGPTTPIEARIVGTTDPSGDSSTDELDEIQFGSSPGLKPMDEVYEPDEDIVDAELVDDDPERPFEPDDRGSTMDRARVKLLILCNELAETTGLDGDELRHAFARSASKGATGSSTQLDHDALMAALDVAEKCKAGERTISKITDDGYVAFKKES